MNEQYYEKLLNIKTSGEQKGFNESLHYNRYEPTSYDVLKSLCDNYEFNKDDSLIDFGCGKGRLNFYINHFYDTKVTGIEMNNFFFEECLSNKKSYLSKNKSTEDKIQFLNCFAEKYKVQKNDNKFYFFNPFSEQIFIKVVGNILDSLLENERQVNIILYYPSEDYLYYLDNYTIFSLKQEIKIPERYDKDPREKIVIYELSYLNLI
ncbi:methyltransferase [Clostridium sp. B9]|uniref:methyltransferase n=1 Tax=Clostridium sp. B9 TaxID=3423224 RepID=UPI003D2EC406